MPDSNQYPYSYHTFLYPFLWDDHGKVSMDTFKSFIQSNGWDEDYLVDGNDQLKSLRRNGANDFQQREDYRTFQYFNGATRKALFKDSDIVACYRLNALKGYDYSIHLGDKWKKHIFMLTINGICLKLFNTGVAVLIFELEYHLPDGRNLETARSDVMLINEYGRRLYPAYIPFLPEGGEGAGDLLCAEKISILSDKEKVICEDAFRDRCKRSEIEADADGYLANPILLPDIIIRLLTWNKPLEEGRTLITSGRKKITKNCYYIEPAIDDRMFVCCCILDDEYGQHFLGYNPWSENAKKCHQEHEWKFMTDWDVGAELYALLNIDPSAGRCSCQNRLEMDRCFEEQLYPRWLEYGTIHAVTNHSMMCITGTDVIDSVVNPFLTLYTQMCILVLAQRASLISFDEKITDVVGRGLNDAHYKSELLKLQKEFAVFQGQLLLPEVTPQIQGIELYQKLQKMLFINELEDNIQKQVKNLFEIMEAEQGNNLNQWGLRLAILALVLAVWQSRELYEQTCMDSAQGIFSAVVCLVLTVFILWPKD